MHGIFFNPPIDNNYLGHQFSEIYKDRIYAPFIEGKNLKTCIEVGANVGVVSYYFAQHFKEVYALEPSVEHFDVLMHMVAHNKLDNIHPINKAIYIKPGKLPFFHNNNKTMYSLHQAVADPNLPTEEVDCVTLPQLLADHAIEHVDFMKVDVEGSETEIFCSTSFKEVADKIDMIILEQHAWSGRHPQHLIDGLKDAGFKDIKTMPSDASIIVAGK